MKKRNLLLALVSGVLLALAMPRPGIWLMSWIGFAPLLVAIRGERPTRAAIYGLITGAVYFGIVLFWISLFGYLPWAAAAVFQGLYFAAFALVSSKLMPERVGWKSYVTVPAAWTALQWVRSLGPFGFTWGSMAHSQAANLPMVQSAAIAGPWVIDFLVCMFNVAVAGICSNSKAMYFLSLGERIKVRAQCHSEDTLSTSPQPSPLRRQRFRRKCESPQERELLGMAVVIIIVLAVWGAGYIALRTAPAAHPRTRIAIIQGNMDQDVVPDINYLASAFVRYSEMSREAAKQGADFIVWPETTLPVAINSSDWGTLLSALAQRTGSNYIIGAYDASDDSSMPLSYNGAHFYSRSGKKLGVYHKARLVPYGEYVPLRKQMPFLKRYRIREQDVLAGKSHGLMRSEIGKVGVSICFESLFPQVSRIETRNGARVLFIITNDGWFQRTAAARQHLMMAQLRAIENRRYVVRGAATGISAVIDPHGRIVRELGIYRQGTVMARVSALGGFTPYALMGDWFAYLCAVITLVFYSLALVDSKTSRGK
ncbi:MAG: apolipoprotein N-acyltransferase [Armatimonadota bacterium]|nr:apolipoprotein N-acyltransferase [bacterium]